MYCMMAVGLFGQQQVTVLNTL